MNKYPKHILLTGAGFSNNWGGFLAQEMWAEVFNNENIQREKRLRELLLSDFDYESIYYSVINENIWTEQEKNAIRTAIQDAYLNLDNTIKYNNSTNPTTVINSLLSCFIPNEEVNEKGIFFTINQDLLVERRLNVNISLLGFPVESDAHKILNASDICELEQEYFIKLPQKEEIVPFDKENRNKCFYIKLHGSQNWKDFDNNSLMIIGKRKKEIIDKIPLLKYYFDFFQKVLSEGDKKLLIIGYGFRDAHINNIISTAIKNNALKIYVILPETIEAFRKNLEINKVLSIYNGLYGYLPYKLSDALIETGIPSYKKFIRLFEMGTLSFIWKITNVPGNGDGNGDAFIYLENYKCPCFLAEKSTPRFWVENLMPEIKNFFSKDLTK